MLKRGFDLIVVVVTGPFWVPVFGMVALLVRLTLGTPVFFRQVRPGKNARLFELLKFRTMTDARDAAGRLLSDGARMTFFGRKLRATSLDELPGLWNVLRGEMSLVGPRPLLTHYLPRYSVRQARRHEVLPGLTGLAQIMGRNSLSWDEKLEWDVKYVETRSFVLDLKILAKTIKVVMTSSGITPPDSLTMPEFQGRSENKIGRP